MSEVCKQVEARLMEALEEIKKEMSAHTEEEMERYNEIIDQQDQLTNKVGHVERQLGSLTDSINTFVATHGDLWHAIKKAFPKNDEGEPDFEGHKNAHVSMIKHAGEERELMDFVRTVKTEQEDWKKTWGQIKVVIFSGIAMAIVTFVGIASWAALLRGPIGY